MLQYLVFVGVGIQLVGIFAYIKDTLRGETKPNRVTWLMWAIAPLIAVAASFSTGVRLATLPVFAMGFFPLIIFVLSFVNPKAYWKLEKTDYICGGFSVLALILWQITGEPRIAIVFAIISDFFASIPTILKSWKYPETETNLAYITATFGTATSFFAITSWNFSAYAFPLYLTAINSLIVFILYRKKSIV